MERLLKDHWTSFAAFAALLLSFLLTLVGAAVWYRQDLRDDLQEAAIEGHDIDIDIHREFLKELRK